MHFLLEYFHVLSQYNFPFLFFNQIRENKFIQDFSSFNVSQIMNLTSKDWDYQHSLSLSFQVGSDTSDGISLTVSFFLSVLGYLFLDSV